MDQHDEPSDEVGEQDANEDGDPLEAVGSSDPIENEGRRYHSRIRNAPQRWSPSSVNIAIMSLMGELSDPRTLSETQSSADWHHWKRAISDELSSLKRHETWEDAILPKGQTGISTRFVFIKKRNADGSLNQYKSRLVTKGYLQGQVDQTYAPVADFNIVRVALTIGVQRHYHIDQLDVATAFLHGEVDEPV